MHIKGGDNIKAITNKDRGKEGKVITIKPKKGHVTMGGVNVIRKHQKSTQLDPEGRILETEAAIHVSNIQLLDPKTNKPTHAGYKFVDGKKVRIAKKFGEEIKSNDQ